MLRHLDVAIWFVILLFLISVNGCGSTSSNGASNSNSGAVALGTLNGSGGAVVWSSAGNYTLSGDQLTSGTLVVKGGTAGFSGTMIMSVSLPANPSTSKLKKILSKSELPTIDISGCNLVVGSQFNSYCPYFIKGGESVPNGIYSIIPTFTATNTGQVQQLDPITLTVTGGLAPTMGNLGIMTNYQSLIPGESISAIVLLSGSVGVFESVNVTITSTNISAITVTPASCKLTTNNNNCQVKIIGLAAGNADITVSSNGYNTVQTTLTVTQPKSYVYVANGGGTISMYKVTPNTGNLISLNPPSITTPLGTKSVAVDPSGHYLYATNSVGNSILMYSIESSTGLLIPLHPASVPVESYPYAVSIDPSGHYLYVTKIVGSDPTATISMYYLDQNTGLLTPLNPLTVTAGLNMSGITVDSSGRYVYALDSTSNNLFMYGINMNTGILTPLNPSTISTGNNPYKITSNPTGTYIYVSNSVDNTISMYRIESSTGLLTSIDIPVSTESEPIGITVDPTGRYMYAVNLKSNSISMYKISLNTGLLTRLNPTTISTGLQPWEIAIEPTGQYAYVTNGDNTVSMYSIVQDTGELIKLNPSTIGAGYVPWGITIATPGGGN